MTDVETTEPTTAGGRLAVALAAVQAQLPKVGKSQTAKVQTNKGPAYSYDYANLADCSRAIMPLLGANGLSFSAKPTMTPNGFVLRYCLRHVSGDEDTGEYPLPDPLHSGAQALGSAITYARRYVLCAVTGLAPDADDDDGAAANTARRTAPQQPPREEAPPRDEEAVRRWIEDFDDTVQSCDDVGQLRGPIWHRLTEKARSGFITQAERDDLAGMVKDRAALIAASTQPEPEPEAEDEAEPDTEPEPPADLRQLKRLHTIMTKLGITDRLAGLADIASVIGHPVNSSKDLTRTEANHVIEVFSRRSFPPEDVDTETGEIHDQPEGGAA